MTTGPNPIKILLVGEAGVGKSQLLHRFAEDTFSSEYISTIGVDFKIRTLTHEGQDVKMHIWEGGGQERFVTIISSYFRGAHVIVLCFDVTSASSATELQRWYDLVQKFGSDSVSVVVVALKSDNRADPQALQIASNFCDAHSLDNFLRCSAKTGEGVQGVFENAIDAALAVDEIRNQLVIVPKKKKAVKKTGHGFFGLGNFFKK